MTRALAFLESLDRRQISYDLDRVRDALMVKVAISAQRWEIEFLADGSVEIERFISAGDIEGEEWLEKLFAEYRN